jgi:hypothetical protein
VILLGTLDEIPYSDNRFANFRDSSKNLVFREMDRDHHIFSSQKRFIVWSLFSRKVKRNDNHYQPQVLQARDCCNEAVIDEGPKIRVLNMADN